MGRVAALAAVGLLAGSVIVAAAGGGVGRPCFDACFDQCVPREAFWFCQFSCYHRCSGGHAAEARGVGGSGDCEHSCVLSMCGQLQPGSKMMAVCRDTCRKSYAAEGCRRQISTSASSAVM
ncbi:hypothetical protein BRADI_2g42530v3 [Brachypodium distachyon]|uniref:Uncharacterized protein n=1 Tax=Brachypodium distachyon TaxID=15368 RepID=I1HP29_BRADI|nr:hypothetical protein BRADI_2g42530v3 [Brachypodium distachyon]